MDLTYQGHTPPSDVYREQVQRMIDASSGRIQRWILMPNHCVRWMSAPSGACVVMDADKPIFADLFCTDLFHGVAVEEIELDESAWTEYKRRSMLKKMSLELVENSPSPASIHSKDDSWVESLGSHRSSVGVYCSRYQDRSTNRFTTRWFVVVRAGLDEATALELETHLYACENAGATPYETFFQDPVVQRARSIAKRNRRRLMGRAIRLLGINTGTRPDGEVVYRTSRVDLDVVTKDSISSVFQYLKSNDVKRLPLWFRIPTTGLQHEFEKVAGFEFGGVAQAMLSKDCTHPLKRDFVERLVATGIKFTNRPFSCGVGWEQENSYVDHVSGDMVFFNDCSSTSSSNGCFTYDQGVSMGLQLLIGPSNSTSGTRGSFRGGSWTNDVYHAFPASVGVQGRGVQDHMCVKPSVGKHDLDTFGCGVELQESPQFRSIHDQRGRVTDKTEERLGYLGSKWGEGVSLCPFLVVLSKE